VTINNSRILPVAALLLAALYLAAGLGMRDPWPPDEPRYVLVAQEMVNSGKWFLPTRGGELYPDKPPVFMWSQAVVYAASGSTRLAFLLPSLLAGLGTLWLVYSCGRDLWDRRTGLVAATLLLCTFQFLKQTSSGQIDAYCACGRHWLPPAPAATRGPAPFWLSCRANYGISDHRVGFLPVLFVPVAMVYRHGGRAPAGSRPPCRWAGVGVRGRPFLPCWPGQYPCCC
jgi:hypothetical protein